jgi:nitrate/nitrite-specific signal transduction histidine kinase
MKNSLRFLSALLLVLGIFLLLLLLWTATVPLEQLHQYAADHPGETGNRAPFQENLFQVETLIWSAAAFSALLGFILPWLISRRVLTPLSSIRNTLRRATRGDPEARVQVHAGKEFEALANELNRMMERQKQDQERLTGLNRTLAAISACRHEMIQETDEKRLIQEICRILVVTGKYRMAWIGYAEEDAHGTVTQAAQAGYQDGNLNTVSESWSETACSAASRAIRNRRSAIISDIFGDPLFAPVQAEATRHGYASILALPLSVNQQTIGALTLHAGKPDAFGTEEVQLLTELADDLAFCIHAIRYTGKQDSHHRPLS